MITKRVNITRQSDKNKHAERGPGDRKRKNSQAACLKSEMFFLLLRFENTFSNLSPLQITFISSSHPCGLGTQLVYGNHVFEHRRSITFSQTTFLRCL